MDKLELELEMELAQCLMQLSHYRCFSESPLFFFSIEEMAVYQRVSEEMG